MSFTCPLLQTRVTTVILNVSENIFCLTAKSEIWAFDPTTLFYQAFINYKMIYDAFQEIIFLDQRKALSYTTIAKIHMEGLKKSRRNDSFKV